MLKVAYVGSSEVFKVGYSQLLKKFKMEVDCLDYSPNLFKELTFKNYAYVILDKGSVVTEKDLDDIRELTGLLDLPVGVIADGFTGRMRINLHQSGVINCIPREHCLEEFSWAMKSLFSLSERGLRPVFWRDFKLYNSEVRIFLNSKELDLTFIEYRMLSACILNKGAPIKEKTFLDNIWGESVRVSKGTLFTHTGNLNKKIIESGVKLIFRKKAGFFMTELSQLS